MLKTKVEEKIKELQGKLHDVSYLVSVNETKGRELEITINILEELLENEDKQEV